MENPSGYKADETDFESYRPLMFSIAYRMLGSTMEAEDIVQDAYLRYRATSPENIQSHRAFLSTIVTRLCLNRLELARSEREVYIGPWLPEPVLTDRDNASLLSEGNQKTYEAISMAFLTLLENLTPMERAIFLLHEVFDYSYQEIADIVGKEETACRQALSRARKHIAANRPRFKSTAEAHKQILDSFMQAVIAGELEGLMKVLAQDVVMWADGGGKARGAATEPLYGPEAVARFVLFSVNYLPESYRIDHVEVNGEPALVLRKDNRAFLVITVETDDRQIHTIRAVANPLKLIRL